MKISSSLVRKLAIVGALLLLGLPVSLYALHFNDSLSAQHIRWGEFGAYVGGVYAPVAAFLTLLILLRQFSSQTDFNKHQIDKSFLADARADLHFYLDQLHQSMHKGEVLAGVPLGNVLVDLFSSKSHDELRTAKYTTNAGRIRLSDDRLSALWGAIYTIFKGLRAVDEPDYKNLYASSKQKCIAMLGYAVCDALDNHHYVACGYPAGFAYEFCAGPQQA